MQPAAHAPTPPAARAQVRIRPPEAGDLAGFVAQARASRALHRPWVYPPETPAAFRAWLARMQPPVFQPFLVCRRDDGAMAGVVNLSQIVRGALQGAYVGYYAFAGFERQGLMRAGLLAVARHAFRELRLHRLEANIQPGNAASRALAQACGFQLEGFSPRYLKVGGRWRDHERWALRAD